MKPTKLKHQETKYGDTVGESLDFFGERRRWHSQNRSTDIGKASGKVCSDLQRATEASFECSLFIANAKKQHNIGEQLIKPACLNTDEQLCVAQVTDKVKTILLSDDNMVKDGTDEMAGDCQKLAA